MGNLRHLIFYNLNEQKLMMIIFENTKIFFLLSNRLRTLLKIGVKFFLTHFFYLILSHVGVFKGK